MISFAGIVDRHLETGDVALDTVVCTDVITGAGTHGAAKVLVFDQGT